MGLKRILKFIIIIILQVTPFFITDAKEPSRDLSYGELFPEKNWKEIADGIELKEITLKRPNWFGFGLLKEDAEGETGLIERVQKINIKVLRVNPKKNLLRLIYCHDIGEKKGADIKTLVKKSSAVGAVTGGYYDYEEDKATMKPVGILTVDGREISKWKAGVNGVFIVNKNGEAEIIRKENYKTSFDIFQAVQAGPVLVKGGEIMADKPQVFDEFKLRTRTAIGITGDKKILMLAVETGFNGLSLYELAEVMKRIGCSEALNLDGGPSAQMFLGYKNAEIYVKGMGKIINAIGIFKK